MFRAIIVDDERYAREELLYLLNKHSDIEVVAEVERGEEGIFSVLEHAPDVVF